MRNWPILLFAVLSASTAPALGRLACYYGSWAVYRQTAGHFPVENIDGEVCTHLIYAFGGLTWEGEVHALDDYNDIGDEWHEGAFTKLQRVKEAYPQLKITLAIGGWNHGPGTFQETVKNPQKRQKFIDSSVEFLRKYNFDGLDIDWEYQDNVGGTEEDKLGFSQLLRDMSQRYRQEGLILSAAVAANFNLIDANYEVPVLSETLDFINVMCYDLHGSWEKYTGHLAPLHALSTEEGYDRNLNVEAVIDRYIERGADPKKINIGLVTYGRCFTLADANDHDIYSPAYGNCEAGDWVPEGGILAYGELCQEINNNQWTVYRNDEQAIPYAVKGDKWVGFDDEKAIQDKIAFAKSKGLGGAMVWSIETDDFYGNCGKGKNPIMNTIKNLI